MAGRPSELMYVELRDINPNGKPSAQEIAVAGMLEPSHLLDIVQNFEPQKAHNFSRQTV